jgi:23S rRNA (uracil1939-C5)-methyltransferase
MERFPEVRSVVNNINERPAQTAFGDKEILLAGSPVIEEKIGPYVFKISANSFFQTNTRMAERLYQTVISMAELSGTETVWDLYAGTGTIGMFLAREAQYVTGFELIESAVNDARENVRTHGLGNITFVEGDILEKLRSEKARPDIIVTDPPRAGMHEKVTLQIAGLNRERIIYVSCNPTTLARDLSLLTDRYRVVEVQPVDMFPHTYHIETVVRLDRLA